LIVLRALMHRGAPEERLPGYGYQEANVLGLTRSSRQGYEYILRNGLNTRDHYPAHHGGAEGPCTFSKQRVGAYMQEYKKIGTGVESQLQEALATKGMG